MHKEFSPMQVYQIYFSPTGGVKKAADLLCSAWGAVTEPIDLLHHVGPLFFSEEDLCLIAVPVYGGRVPEAALRGLRMMKGNAIPTVLLAVYGNRAVDDALLELRDEVRAAGFACFAAVSAVAQHSLLPVFGQNRPDEKDAQELASFAKDILRAWEEGKETEPQNLPGHRPYRVYNGVPLKPKITSRCVGCGICARACPVQAISTDDPGKPDKSKCISCMHCVSICPENARRLSRPMLYFARKKLSDACAERKPNALYL